MPNTLEIPSRVLGALPGIAPVCPASRAHPADFCRSRVPRQTDAMTIMKDEPHGAIRIEVFLNPRTERFGLQIVDEGPHLLSQQEMENVLSLDRSAHDRLCVDVKVTYSCRELGSHPSCRAAAG